MTIPFFRTANLLTFRLAEIADGGDKGKNMRIERFIVLSYRLYYHVVYLSNSQLLLTHYSRNRFLYFLAS
jgi:hypothetical protein